MALRTDLPYVASKGLKSISDGLAAKTIDDMMEQTGPNDPDSIGEDVNMPATTYLQNKDALPSPSYGKGQRDE